MIYFKIKLYSDGKKILLIFLDPKEFLLMQVTDLPIFTVLENKSEIKNIYEFIKNTNKPTTY